MKENENNWKYGKQTGTRGGKRASERRKKFTPMEKKLKKWEKSKTVKGENETVIEERKITFIGKRKAKK